MRVLSRPASIAFCLLVSGLGLVLSGCAVAPAPPVCGDGNVNDGEVCDDGNTNAGDGCNATCESDETCGNGIVDVGEVCDDSNAVGGDGCSAICDSVEACGDGVLDIGETCDDGNQLGDDGCSATCAQEYCGNGATEGVEVCDDGNTQSGDGCSAACDSDETCGNGVLDVGEACEDGNTDSGDGCNATCESDETCGNGFVDVAEICDDGNTDNGDGCNATCESDETCGNGYTDVGEECDDGNNQNGDACSNACLYLSGVLFMVREGDDMLRSLDTETLTFTDVGNLTTSFAFGELAWDTVSNTMWMVEGRGSNSLYTVDINTGAADHIGTHGITDLFGLAHDPTTNTLFASGESPSGFYTMNTATGAAMLVNDPGVALDGLTYDSTRDQIVGLAAGGEMYVIDKATGIATQVSDEGFVNNCGLAYDPFNDVYWAVSWDENLYSYNPNAGYTRTVVLTGIGDHDGITFVPGVP